MTPSVVRRGIGFLFAFVFLGISMLATGPRASAHPALRGHQPGGSARRALVAETVIRYARTVQQFVITPTVAPIAIAGNYALVDWIAGEGGGEALLRLKNGSWHVLGMGGGSIDDPRYLESQYGVPSKIADELIARMSKSEHR